ncbi:MAG: protein kinase [Polyangiaceae bacterium]
MAARLNPGEIFAGIFRVEAPLSAGGMGMVYRVVHIPTGRHRALKLMLPELVKDVRFLERFHQEATVGARIASEHVVEVIDAGVDQATGMPWLAMELLEGEDLDSHVHRRGPLSPIEVMEVFRQAGHALGAAHKGGVVHRDLKPENLFLAVSRRQGVAFIVKVLDFGIAKVVAEARSSSTATIGTPLWMAPEQTTPHAPITAAADLWPLGLLGFFLLTGKVFWRAAHLDGGQMAILREVAFEPIPPASIRANELGVAHLLPPNFDAWFARCVARDPGARYPSVDELVASLESLLNVGPPVRMSSPSLMNAPPTAAASYTPVGDVQIRQSAPPNDGRQIVNPSHVAMGTGEFVASTGRTPIGMNTGPQPGWPTPARHGTAPSPGVTPAGGPVPFGSGSGPVAANTSALPSPTPAQPGVITQPGPQGGPYFGQPAPTQPEVVATRQATGQPMAVPAVPVATAHPPEKSSRSWVLLVGLLLGLTGIGVGVGLYMQRQDTKSPSQRTDDKESEGSDTPHPNATSSSVVVDSATPVPSTSSTDAPSTDSAVTSSDSSVSLAPTNTWSSKYPGPSHLPPSAATTSAPTTTLTVEQPTTPTVATTTPPPDTFDSGAARTSLSFASYKGCARSDGPHGPGTVSVTFAPTGKVTGVSVSPPYSGTPTGACVTQAFKSAKAPPYTGPPHTVSYPISL